MKVDLHRCGSMCFGACEIVKTAGGGVSFSRMTPELARFYSYAEGTLEYLLYDFYSHRSENGDSRMAQRNFLNCIPIFSSEDEKRSFLAYAMNNFRRDRTFITNDHFTPHFPDSLSNGTDINYFKRAYHDALVIIDLYQEFIIGKENLPQYVGE